MRELRRFALVAVLLLVLTTLASSVFAWDADKMYYGSFGTKPNQAYGAFPGFGLESGGTAGVNYFQNPGTAWQGEITEYDSVLGSGKVKYRSDTQPLWSFNTALRTGLLWKVWVTGNSNAKTGINIRNGSSRFRLDYNSATGTWVGADGAVFDGGIAPPMTKDAWHTVRLEVGPSGSSTFEFWIDESTKYTGYSTGAPTGPYLQFGTMSTLSSGTQVDTYTAYFFWSQGDAITPIPEPGSLLVLLTGSVGLAGTVLRRRAR